MAWAIVLTVFVLKSAHFYLGLKQLFAKPSEPSGPFRRPQRANGPTVPLTSVHYVVINGRPVRADLRTPALEKVNWKEEGF